jgi:hypothetical protein
MTNISIGEPIGKDFVDGHQMLEGHVIPDWESKFKFGVILALTSAKSIFEIGFNGGHSARLFLSYVDEFKIDKLHSIDICRWDYTEKIAKTLENNDSRFTFEKKDSLDLTSEEMKGYDLIFIDGNHDTKYIKNDLRKAIESGTPYILIDDYIHQDTGYGGFYTTGDDVDKLIYELRETGYRMLGSPLHYSSTHQLGKMALFGLKDPDYVALLSDPDYYVNKSK